MPYGYFFDTSTNIAVITDSNTFSSVFNTDYSGNQITGFQLNGVDIGSMITPNDSGLFLTANNYHYLINSNNINTTFSFTKPKPRVAVTNCYRTYTYVDYTFYEFRHGSTGKFQLNTSIPNIVLDLNVLLIGGGGAGGHYSTATSGGAGGGGAGSYVTTIIKAPATTSLFTSVYFDINVGAGGAGTNNGNTSGSPGGPSIITYVSQPTIGNTTYYSLTAGGGGSGGSVQNSSGIIDQSIYDLFEIYGSTGGACGSVSNQQWFYARGTNAGYTTDNGTIFTEIECSLNRGGNTYYLYGGGGGGGAGGPGQDTGGNLNGGNGGDGKTWINNVTYAGGGGGAKSAYGGNDNSWGGSGGGGNSATLAGQSGDATQHTGSGGGAAWQGDAGLWSGNGGSGICIIAVKTSDISL
jgi:hypothetical protein